MHRAWLQPGQAKLMQPFSDRAFMHLDPEPAYNLGAQVNAAPPHHLVPLRIGPRHHQGLQLSFLLGR